MGQVAPIHVVTARPRDIPRGGTVVTRLSVLIALSLLVLPIAHAQVPEAYDIVLRGGRVMDPDTGLDAVRNVGIRGDRIVEISELVLRGGDVIDASGLVVAPGFIDLHAHGQTNEAHEYQAHDGVTTALELESGQSFVAEWLQSRAGDSILNFGATVSHRGSRWQVMAQYRDLVSEAEGLISSEGLNNEIRLRLRGETRDADYASLDDTELARLPDILTTGLTEGALGIGSSVGYFPAASRDEVFRVYQLAAAHNAPVFTHVREGGISAIQEVLSNAAITGAPLHIVHINSMVLGDISVALEMVASAQAEGLDVTTEVYPYTAASTYLQSAMFDPGWQERIGVSYGDLQWVATGERLTEETFAAYRQEGGVVIIHMMRPEWIERGVVSPVTMIASDGMPYAPGAHPRSAGTFARVLGRYVRQTGSLSLMDALAKMTIRPARRLDQIAPSMRLKGRLQVGSDADITVFDPEEVIDAATFEEGLKFSEEVRHVW